MGFSFEETVARDAACSLQPIVSLRPFGSTPWWVDFRKPLLVVSENETYGATFARLFVFIKHCFLSFKNNFKSEIVDFPRCRDRLKIIGCTDPCPKHDAWEFGNLPDQQISP